MHTNVHTHTHHVCPWPVSPEGQLPAAGSDHYVPAAVVQHVWSSATD